MYLPSPSNIYERENEAQFRHALEQELVRVRTAIAGINGGSYSKAQTDAKFLPFTGGVLTGDITLGAAGSKVQRSQTYPGLGVSIKPTASIADLATVDIGASDMLGLALITADNGASALALLAGVVLDTTVLAVRGAWTKVAGTAASINVYWDNVNNKYRIENKSGSARIFYVVRFGNPVTM